jgi:hypothetical protein
MNSHTATIIALLALAVLLMGSIRLDRDNTPRATVIGGGQTTLSTTPSQIVGGACLSGHILLRSAVGNSVLIRIGQSTVAAGAGYSLSAGERVQLPALQGVVGGTGYWAVADSGTPVLERLCVQ